MRFVWFLSLAAVACANEHPLFDVKKVIKGALDMMASVPSSAPQTLNETETALRDQARKQLSRLFHLPSDFLHRLAAQSGYIDYDPTPRTSRPRTTTKPAQWRIFENGALPISAAVTTTTTRPTEKPLFNDPLDDNDDSGTAFVQEDVAESVDEQKTQSPFKQFRNAFTAQRSTPLRIPSAQPSNTDTTVSSQAAQNAMLRALLQSGQLYYKPTGSSLTQLPQAIQQGTKTYIPLPQSLGTLPLQPLNSLPSSQDALVSVSVPTTESGLVFESEANLRPSTELSTVQSIATTQQTTQAKHQDGALPMQKQYNLRDVENHEYYALQKKVLEMNRRIKEEELRRKMHHVQVRPVQQVEKRLDRLESAHRHGGSPLKQIRISRVDVNPDANVPVPQPLTAHFRDAFSASFEEERRMNVLRKKLIDDRKRFSARKLPLVPLRRVSPTTSKQTSSTTFQLTRQHCLNVRSFARQFGVLDIKKFAATNCNFIESYYSNLKCAQIEQYVDRCTQLFGI